MRTKKIELCKPRRKADWNFRSAFLWLRISCRMREKIKTAASILVILILLPYVAVVFCTGELAGGQTEPEEIQLERCVAQILPMQISVTYETEALKAQAVVIRTNLLRAAMEYYGAADWQQAVEDLREADLEALGFSVCTEDGAEKLWSYENRQRYEEKCRTAAEETLGPVLALDGELKDLPYHAVSAGKTREGGTLGKDYAYLASVDCEGDVASADYLQISYFPDMELPVIESRDSAGYVMSVRLADETLTGEAFRFRYKLNSSCFTTEETDGGVRVVTRGLGHGFGMSLYTAGRMALAGQTYREILSYFYKNLDCISITENGYARDSEKQAE